MTRMSELVRLVGADLRDMRAPLSHAFLVDSDVTFEEVHDLSDLLALVCELTAHLLEHPDDLAALIEGGATVMSLRAVTRALTDLGSASGVQGG